MKRILLVLMVLLMVCLLFGCEQLREGKVVAMEHHYAWAQPYIHHITHHHSMKVGKTTHTWNTYEDKPAYHLHNEYWKVVIESTDNDKGELRSATWYVAEIDYRSMKIGQWLEVPENAQGHEPIYDVDADQISPDSLAQYKILDNYVEEQK